ncbi:hypothetical protein [Lentimicrobium sp. S6]|uniref:hypothetical protein n=1 Tax=Lentimicrobium sp. S6 TaxID=2735872 RepID=UPI0015564095|nr:hypothetical protein [Lentimicrobium sp. S6]NPD44655.1 hypothetical protein [Lentimicrobium sp. S6]
MRKIIQNNGEQNPLARIYFKEIMKRINKKDIRSACSWCEKNKVEIYQDCSGKFVIDAEFDLAYNRPIINRYKSKYGKDWLKMYELCKENKLHIADMNHKEISRSKRYQPKSKASSDFLNKFK